MTNLRIFGQNRHLCVKKLAHMIQNIAQSVRYIGVDDLDLDLFESQYVIPEGMAYNSYLLEGEKLAVLDTVDERKAEAWKANTTEATRKLPEEIPRSFP